MPDASHFIRVKITPEMREEMKRRHREAGDKWRGATIEDGKGRIWGLLLEIVVESIIKIEADFTRTYQYDFKIGNHTWDIKAKTRKDPPRRDWDASVQEQTFYAQRPDFYLFGSIVAAQSMVNQPLDFVLNYPYEEAYICGFISRNAIVAGLANKNRDFQNFKKGQTDPANGTTFKRCNEITIRYGALLSPQILLGRLKP